MQNFIALTDEYCAVGMTVRTFCFYLVAMLNLVPMLFSIWLGRLLTISRERELPLITGSAFDSAMGATRRCHDSELCSVCTTGTGRMCKCNLKRDELLPLAVEHTEGFFFML